MDNVTASLLKEAGISQPQGARPDWSALSAQGRAEQPERDATARAVVSAEGGADPAAQAPMSQEQWSARLGGAPAANDPVTASLLREVENAKASAIPGQEDMPEAKRPASPPSAFEKYVKGPAEVAATVATSAAGSLVGNVAGIAKGLFGGKYGTPEGAREAAARAQEIAQSLTYTPRTESGQEQLAAVAEALSASKLQGLGPPEGMMLGALAATGPRAAARNARAAVSDIPGATPHGASVGAAGVNVAEQAKALAATASPELQAEVAKIGPKITQRGLKTLERHVDAETLPVPIKLTEGQATRDVAKLSQERNARASKEAYAKRFNEQNEQLIANTEAIREKAAPDVYVNSRPELGDMLISAYREKDRALNAAIGEKYKALRDANGGQFPLDGVAFVDAADAALHKALVYDFVPPALRSTMNRLREGGKMTFEQFEAMRTNLARIARSQADGNEKHAAALIRESLENMPLTAEAAQLKPLADAARAAAKERFDLIKSDPAYKSVVNGKASADKFIQKHVISGDTQNVARMKENLAHDPAAQQAMAAGAIRRLQDSAGIVDGQGAFSQAKYNKALQELGPKLGVLFDSQVRGDLEKLGRVSFYSKEFPPGSFVNTSNTATVLLGELAKAGAEGAANIAAAKGIPVGMIRRATQGMRESREMKQSLKTGAGLSIKDIAEGK